MSALHVSVLNAPAALQTAGGGSASAATSVLPEWFEITALIVMTVVLIADLVIVVKRPHVPSFRECVAWVSFYVALAVIFAALMFWLGDATHGSEFLVGWLTEYSLSIDNLFVFVIIMAQFAVPKRIQQQALMIGIIMALVLRGLFILLGAQLIDRFSWIFYVFGAWLVWTAIQQVFGGHSDTREDGWFIRGLRKRVRLTDEYHEAKFRVSINGVKYFTPMLIVLTALGTTDLLFALDSIPAIFGITQSSFIVFTANVFALMGLRQLYFLLGGLLERLEYLKYGIAFILAFIGVKLVLHAMHANELPFLNGGHPIEWAPDISTWASLGVILGSMFIATVASLVKARAASRRRGHTLGEEVPKFTEQPGAHDAGH